MIRRNAFAVWEGTLKDGQGKIHGEGGAFEAMYSFVSRFNTGKGTNPEELLGAAHAGCFSMALVHRLAEIGYAPKWVRTKATVQLDQIEGEFRITGIELTTVAKIPDLDEERFFEQAEIAKNVCPVSQALKGVRIKLLAKLVTEGGSLLCHERFKG
jgi:osmotically inducible protein OsmC